MHSGGLCGLRPQCELIHSPPQQSPLLFLPWVQVKDVRGHALSFFIDSLFEKRNRVFLFTF